MKCYNIHYGVYNSTPLVPIQILMNPLFLIFVRLATIGLLFPHLLLCFPFSFFYKIPVDISFLSYICYIPHSSHFP